MPGRNEVPPLQLPTEGNWWEDDWWMEDPPKIAEEEQPNSDAPDVQHIETERNLLCAGAIAMMLGSFLPFALVRFGVVPEFLDLVVLWLFGSTVSVLVLITHRLLDGRLAEQARSLADSEQI